MRTIKFRGKTKDGKWVFGDFVRPYVILEDEDVDLVLGKAYLNNSSLVIQDTVGQFTGLYDKNGKEIYEGDILREPPKKDYDKENYVAYEVFWHGNDCASHHIGWQMNRCHFQGCICGTMYIPEFLPKTTARMEVIGNVFDNSDLIEKGGNDEEDNVQ